MFFEKTQSNLTNCYAWCSYLSKVSQITEHMKCLQRSNHVKKNVYQTLAYLSFEKNFDQIWFCLNTCLFITKLSFSTVYIYSFTTCILLAYSSSHMSLNYFLCAFFLFTFFLNKKILLQFYKTPKVDNKCKIYVKSWMQVDSTPYNAFWFPSYLL